MVHVQCWGPYFYPIPSFLSPLLPFHPLSATKKNSSVLSRIIINPSFLIQRSEVASSTPLSFGFSFNFFIFPTSITAMGNTTGRGNTMSPVRRRWRRRDHWWIVQYVFSPTFPQDRPTRFVAILVPSSSSCQTCILYRTSHCIIMQYTTTGRTIIPFLFPENGLPPFLPQIFFFFFNRINSVKLPQHSSILLLLGEATKCNSYYFYFLGKI